MIWLGNSFSTSFSFLEFVGHRGFTIVSSQRGSFWDGYPSDIRGSFARISRPQNFGQGAQNPGKASIWAQDIRDPKVWTSTTLRDVQKKPPLCFPKPHNPRTRKGGISVPIDRVKFSIRALKIFNPGLKVSIPLETVNQA